MVFSSPTFLFLFLPLVLGLAHAAPRAWRNPLLLAASLFFYAWGETLYVAVMLASIAFNYAAGLAIDRALGAAGRRAALALAVTGNLGMLGAFKYAGFLAANARGLVAALGLAAAPEVPPAPGHLPLGISFFTFQALSYVIDVYRGEVRAQRSPVRLALFVSLFPQLVAGPIVRYRQIAAQLEHRVVALESFAEGVRRFTIGLGKKVLVANTLAAPADAIFALPVGDLDPVTAWFGISCYALQIYFDFSGYSDMAIGIGRMLGFSFPENFDLPYTARSLTEFWRRWHISLSTWFRDYLYVPLGGNRRGPARTFANLWIVFLLCGLWHGASWNFVVWGALHGGLLVAERAGLSRALARVPQACASLYCLLSVTLAWVFFRADDLGHAVGYLAALWRPAAGAARHLPVDFADPETFAVFALAVVGAGRWWREPLRRLEARPALGAAASTAALLGILLACGMKLADHTYDPFIYFRF